jgi:hypothetical protein
LTWVRQVAHERPEVDVWATGNQMLTVEASIHGTVHAGVVWTTLFEESVETRYSGGGAEYYKPARDDRLRVIQECYERFHDREDLRLIVVDDSDLSAMESEGWEYYTAWEFVPAALDGKFAEFFEPGTRDASEPECPVDHRYSLDTMDESVSLPTPPAHLRDGCMDHYDGMSEAVERTR